MQNAMPNDIPEEVMDRISKLFAKATNTDNEHEAEAFMGKVQQELLKYNLSISHLENHKRKGKDDVKDDMVDMNNLTNRKEGDWAKELIWGIAHFNMCRAIYHSARYNKDDMGGMSLIGTISNMEVAKQMMGYLFPTIKDWHKRAWKEYQHLGGEQKAGAYKRDFLIACVRRLRARMNEITLANKRELERANENVTALMVVNNKAVDTFIENKFGTLGNSKLKATKDRDGAYHGDEAGRKISLNNQVGGGSQKGLIS